MLAGKCLTQPPVAFDKEKSQLFLHCFAITSWLWQLSRWLLFDVRRVCYSKVFLSQTCRLKIHTCQFIEATHGFLLDNMISLCLCLHINQRGGKPEKPRVMELFLFHDVSTQSVQRNACLQATTWLWGIHLIGALSLAKYTHSSIAQVNLSTRFKLFYKSKIW